jgi:carboxyl-terminal processing protease
LFAWASPSDARTHAKDEEGFEAIFRRIEAVYPLPYDKQILIDRAVAAVQEMSVYTGDEFDKCLGEVRLGKKNKLPSAFATALVCAHWFYLPPDEHQAAFDTVASAIMSSLDPQSEYLSGTRFAELIGQADLPIGSIGVSLVKADNGFEIVKISRGAPARAAGLLAGEKITAINGVAASDLVAARQMLHGEVGSTVKLGVLAKDGTKRDVTVTRLMIDGVQSAFEFERRGNMLILHLDSLPANISTELQKQFSEQMKGIEIFVLDLRGNPGGVLDESFGFADLFLNKGLISSIVGKDIKDTVQIFALEGDVTNGKPIIVLTNKETSSGAEIIAAALQDQKRAIVLGHKTYGAGTVQTIVPFTKDSAIKLTTSRIFRADEQKRALSDAPVMPDCIIDPDRGDIFEIAGTLVTKGLAACPVVHP